MHQKQVPIILALGAAFFHDLFRQDPSRESDTVVIRYNPSVTTAFKGIPLRNIGESRGGDGTQSAPTHQLNRVNRVV